MNMLNVFVFLLFLFQAGVNGIYRCEIMESGWMLDQ